MNGGGDVGQPDLNSTRSTGRQVDKSTGRQVDKSVLIKYINGYVGKVQAKIQGVSA